MRVGRWLTVVKTMNAVDADGKVVGKIQVLSDDTKIQTIGNVKVVMSLGLSPESNNCC